VTLAIAPLQAADQRVEAAVAAFTAVSGDASKAATFCGMLKLAAKVSESANDAEKLKTLTAELEGAVKSLGKDFYQAWLLRAQLDPGKIDAVPYYVALKSLVEKCK
jgi:hypothetical protein